MRNWYTFMMLEKSEKQEQSIGSFESVNTPTYEEVLSFSGLSENQFSFDQYKQYKNRIQMRVRLIDEQLAYFESELLDYERLSLSSTQEKLYFTCKEMVSKGGANERHSYESIRHVFNIRHKRCN